MRKITVLLGAATLLLLLLGRAPVWSDASPVPSPPCPQMRWYGDLSMSDAYSQCSCRGGVWTVADYAREPWLYACVEPALSFDSPLPTPEIVPGCCGGWWRLDPWMGVYPLWTNGTDYHVEGWQ